jgi:hypothetical protein
VPTHRTIRRTFVALLVGSLLAACSSTTQGRGLAAGGGTPTETVRPSDSGLPTDALPTDTATTSDTPTPTLTTSSATPPSPVPAPKECPGGTCKAFDSADLGNGYTFVLRGNDGYGGGVGASIVELTKGGVPIYWWATNGQTPGGLMCSTGGAVPNCVVVDYTGAHASLGTVWALSGGTLHRGSTVTVDTPGTSGRDLNGDGLVDVVALQNDYTPDYATGRVYWQTWVSNATKLTSTGCTTPSHAPAPAPTKLVTGSCP